MGKENTRAFVLKVGKREKENGKSANARYSRGPRGKTRGSRVIANKIIKKMYTQKWPHLRSQCSLGYDQWLQQFIQDEHNYSINWVKLIIIKILVTFPRECYNSRLSRNIRNFFITLFQSLLVLFWRGPLYFWQDFKSLNVYFSAGAFTSMVSLKRF